MVVHWVVVADSAHAQVFAADVLFEELTEIHSLVHPESRMKAKDLVAGDRGSTQGHAEGMKTRFERHTDPHRATIDSFAREIAELVQSGRVAHAYERLVIVAPPAFLGMLRNQLDAQTTRLLVASLALDWKEVPVSELPQRLRAGVAEKN